MIDLKLGNCLDLLNDLEDNSIDLVLLDLPYGQTNCEWDKKIDLDDLWIKLKKKSKDKTCFIFFCSVKFGYELIKSNEKWFRYDLVWSKNSSAGFLSCKKMPLRSHELIYVFYKKLPTYNVNEYHKKVKDTNMNSCNENINNDVYKSKKLPYQHGGIYEPKLPNSILNYSINRNPRTRNHPTEKPIELYDFLIKYYSNENDNVLDVCFGSGNSAISAKNLNRNYIGFELNENYYNNAIKRINIE